MADPVFKKDKVFQELNLRDMFGVDFKDLPELREAIGQAAIEKILARTEKGQFRPGERPSAKAFSYSDSYAKSLAFKAAGKSKGDVNMKLDGDMLGTLDIIEVSANKVTIGWDDELQAAKAYNHNTGDTVPKRPFFGLSKSELKALEVEFRDEVKAAAKDLRKNGRDEETDKFMRIINKLADRASDDDGED